MRTDDELRRAAKHVTVTRKELRSLLKRAARAQEASRTAALAARALRPATMTPAPRGRLQTLARQMLKSNPGLLEPELTELLHLAAQERLPEVRTTEELSALPDDSLVRGVGSNELWCIQDGRAVQAWSTASYWLKDLPLPLAVLRRGVNW